ncbi:hypothetical protein H257_14651 [Aphanomyces astaci]|uniref:SCP domain-containing protein n=1 Tax=Aphanomyces astaci TaxID=112090 RepID=W4FS37_APHAT|nr:hypothetical protein H257_14651 [Aphanomyces astaci]ETV69629.1 hypothetical protein H257_14651 [Aphanomyces astaci]RQM11005.1 hypothetical protein B5M09_009365 [Aphanomyces astaci]|eukprot:XP_009840845.1 hypothetical protein H257_14651 [Aphanomyces astaci]
MKPCTVLATALVLSELAVTSVDAHGRLPYTYAPVPSINSCDTPVAVSSAVPTSVPQPTRGPSAAGVTKHVTWNFFTTGSPDCFASLTKDDLNSGLFAGAENIPADCGKTASFTYNGVTVTAKYAWRTTGGQGYNELSPQAFANLLGVQVNVANVTRAEALQLPINDPGYVIGRCVGTCGIATSALTTSTPTSTPPSVIPGITTPAPIEAPTGAPIAASTAAPETSAVTPASTTTTPLIESTLAPTTSRPITPSVTASLRLATTAAPTTPILSTPANAVRDQLISQHNKIRGAHGVGPVTWDDTLAPKMQAWANSCPGFKHGGPTGWQNLATHTPCGTSTTRACDKVVGAPWLWYDEEETFWNYGSNTCNGDWAKCGHFSNLISPEVKSIACGWSQCANGNYVWCNYNTPVKNPKVSPIRGITKPQLLASLVV